jgi:beta-galactosidase
MFTFYAAQKKTGWLFIIVFTVLSVFTRCNTVTQPPRTRKNFDANWRFHLGDLPAAEKVNFTDTSWRKLNLPHDWSIEGKFNRNNPGGEGYLPNGIGWYRKTFTLPLSDKGKLIFIDFDGVYMNSKVWINGHLLGKRPYGYISFRYELTPYLNYGNKKNVIAVQVDNSKQPNSRWYSGSGIYRNVWLVKTNKVYIAHWGTFITTPEITKSQAKVQIQTRINNREQTEQLIMLKTVVLDDNNKQVATSVSKIHLNGDTSAIVQQKVTVANPDLWSVLHHHLYRAVSYVMSGNKILDWYQTIFGIRYFHFDANKGFFLNGKHIKIKGVCQHENLGPLGAAVNTRALERQLEILKKMGCNAIRTAHNPPSPELLKLTDKMGFMVLDEAFDVWNKGKVKYDYHLYFDKWHQRDLSDFVKRDRNHPSVIMWSIGNEIPDQYSPKGAKIGKELANIVKTLDATRPITSAMNYPEAKDNYLARSGALDLIGHNYGRSKWMEFHKIFPGQKFIATETTSSLATRGYYDMPSDSIRIWPTRKAWQIIKKEKKKNKTIDYEKLFAKHHIMNPGFTCSAYDNCCVPWGSTDEQTWKIVKKYDFIAGLFIWTGFDYIGEPTPYPWPARSSYFGIVDLAGFPKDVYYLYQSEWTRDTILHIFPHWNWQKGDTIDVWAYTNCKKVELFLNGKSLGTRTKQGDELHLMWRVPYAPGTLKAVGYMNNTVVKTTEIKTAGKPAKILLHADRSQIHANGKDLSFVTITIVDNHGIVVPYADNRVKFRIEGPATIAGVANGCQTSLEPFKANYRKAFNGKCLVVLQSTKKPGKIVLTAVSAGLQKASLTMETN